MLIQVSQGHALQLRTGMLHFLVASNVDSQSAFKTAVSLGNTLLWRLSLRYVELRLSYSIGSVDAPAHICRELEDRTYAVPVALLAFHCVWIFTALFLGDPSPGFQCLPFLRSLVDAPEVRGVIS